MPEQEPEPQAESQPTVPQSGVDLEELARKIFEILLRELQLENERTGR